MDHKIKKLIWLVVFCVAFSACGPVDTVTETQIPVPTPCRPVNNIYANPISSDINALYELGVRSSDNPSEYENVQRNALINLINHVFYFSDSAEVPLDGKTARITITYISPELVQYIIVNHYLFNRFLDFSGKLDEQIQAHTKKFIDRNEHVFFIIFTASVYTVDQTSSFDFPMENLVLTNTNDAKFIPEHKDPILKRTIDLTDGPKYGFFYYPMAIVENGNCKIVLDENYDTNIELSISNIVINDEDMGSQSWNYKLATLIDTGGIQGTHNEKFTLTPPTNQLSPAASSLPAWSLESQEFWAALARIIWLEVTEVY